VPSEERVVICSDVDVSPPSVRVRQVRPRSVEYSYLVIAEPPLSGALKLTVRDWLLGVTFVFKGRLIAPGTVFGEAETVDEAMLWPIELMDLIATW